MKFPGCERTNAVPGRRARTWKCVVDVWRENTGRILALRLRGGVGIRQMRRVARRDLLLSRGEKQACSQSTGCPGGLEKPLFWFLWPSEGDIQPVLEGKRDRSLGTGPVKRRDIPGEEMAGSAS